MFLASLEQPAPRFTQIITHSPLGNSKSLVVKYK